MPRSTTPSEQIKSDHDLLVQLAITQKLNHEATTSQIANVKSEVVEVKDGLAVQVARMDGRLAVLETFKETKVAEEKIARWNKTADVVEEHLNDKAIERREKVLGSVERWQDRWKFILPAVLVVLGFIYWVVLNVIVPAFMSGVKHI